MYSYDILRNNNPNVPVNILFSVGYRIESVDTCKKTSNCRYIKKYRNVKNIKLSIYRTYISNCRCSISTLNLPHPSLSLAVVISYHVIMSWLCFFLQLGRSRILERIGQSCSLPLWRSGRCPPRPTWPSLSHWWVTSPPLYCGRKYRERLDKTIIRKGPYFIVPFRP